MIGKKNWTVDDREKKRRKSSWKVKRVPERKRGGLLYVDLKRINKNINQFPPNSNDNIMKRREGVRREDTCVYVN